jgi:alkylation response protein AidB-like acyl-CoA dehydrogenase
VPTDPLTDEQREIRDLIRMLARERIAPRAAEIDKSSEFPWDVVELFREHGIFGVMYDGEYGGLGASALMTLVAVEEVSKVCATSGLILAVQELGSLGLKLAGSDEQKDRYLPRLATGEWLTAYALTEPGSGSDSAAMRSEARHEGDAYIINGSKRFITNLRVRRRVELARLRGRPDRAEDGDQGVDDRRAVLHRHADPGRQPPRRGGRGLQDRHADPRPVTAGDRSPGARARPGRH